MGKLTTIFVKQAALRQALLLSDLLTNREVPVLVGQSKPNGDGWALPRLNIEFATPHPPEERVNVRFSLPLTNGEGEFLTTMPSGASPEREGLVIPSTRLAVFLGKAPTKAKEGASVVEVGFAPEALIVTAPGAGAISVPAMKPGGREGRCRYRHQPLPEAALTMKPGWVASEGATDEVLVHGISLGHPNAAKLRARLPAQTMLVLHTLMNLGAPGVSVGVNPPRRIIWNAHGGGIHFTATALLTKAKAKGAKR